MSTPASQAFGFQHQSSKQQPSTSQFQQHQQQVPQQQGNGTDKTKLVKAQVDEVVGIMQTNIEKVMERGENLENLQVKTDNLQQGALQFKRGATQVRKKMWWKNMKMNIIIGLILFAILLAIILGIIVPLTSNNNGGK